MSEWHDKQKKPNTKLRDLLKSNKAKTRKLSELSKTEQNRLAKLNAMLDELRRGVSVQNRRLATWLTEVEYERFEGYWESQLQIREELNDKPDELKRYEGKIRNQIEAVDADTKWAALKLMLASSASVAALAKEMTKPDTKTVTRTTPISKTKVTKQPVQQAGKLAAKDASRTAIKSITPQKPLSNQQIS